MKTIQLLIILAVTTGVYLTMPRYTITYGEVQLQEERNAIDVLPTDSFLSCAFLCEDKNSSCTLASYNYLSGECTMHHWLNVNAVAFLRDPITVLDTRVIINSQNNFLRFQILGARYGIAFSEGDALCERFGGIVASLTDMDDAIALGWSSCGCSWLNDGFPYYWLHADDYEDGCHSGWKVNCKDFGLSTYDLHCSFK